MSWFVDNANGLYVLLGIVAAGFVIAWRFTTRVKYLGYAAGALVLLGLVWLLTLVVPTDSKQLEANVLAMARAVEAGKTDDLFKHIAKDFTYKTMTRDKLYQAARQSIEAHRVSEIRITKFEVEDISRPNKSAKVRFKVTAFATGQDQPYPFVTRADFILEGEQWKLRTMRFYKAFVDTDQEIHLPGL